MNAPHDSQTPLSLARILTLDGQAIARGLLDAETEEGQFQATEISDLVSIELLTEVLAEVGTRRLHLVDWRRCASPFADHFHFHTKVYQNAAPNRLLRFVHS